MNNRLSRQTACFTDDHPLSIIGRHRIDHSRWRHRSQLLVIMQSAVLPGQNGREALNGHSPKNSPRTIHELFEHQAVRTPGNIAVIEEDQEISYDRLDRTATQLANYLVKRGAGAG